MEARAVAFHVLFLLLNSVAPLPNTCGGGGGGGGGFATRLIHRDSPASPLYIPSANPSDRWDALRSRSLLRLNYLSQRPKKHTRNFSIWSPVIPTGSDYLMWFSIGTPRKNVLAGVDTSGGMIWIQCLPCALCFRQQAPIFDPSSSSSFKPVPCQTEKCNSVSQSRCVGHGRCVYSVRYDDGSYTNGVVGIEDIDLTTTGDDRVTLQKLIFGCGHNNSGRFETVQQGVVGLNMGPSSLIEQMGNWGSWTFSHCFVRIEKKNSGSMLVFGEDAVLSGSPTPLAASANETSLYYLDLDDISVGEERLNIPPGTFRRGPKGENGLIIDSGTPMTLLKTAAYDRLVAMLREMVRLEPFGTGACFRGSARDLEEGKVPVVTFHFKRLDVSLQPWSTFMAERDVVCLAMMPTNGMSVFGTIAQQNLHVGYDIKAGNIYMSPADCEKA